jgi:hypothetical protein
LEKLQAELDYQIENHLPAEGYHQRIADARDRPLYTPEEDLPPCGSCALRTGYVNTHHDKYVNQYNTHPTQYVREKTPEDLLEVVAGQTLTGGLYEL